MRDAKCVGNLADVSLHASLYCITEVRLMTFKSAIFAKLFRISSCTPSVKNAFSGSALRLANGSTAMLFDGIAPVAVINFSCERRNIQNPTPTATTRRKTATAADLNRKVVLARLNLVGRAVFPT